MRKLVLLFLTINCAYALDTTDLGGMEERIAFRSTSILLADTVVDGYRYIPYTTRVKKIIVCFEYSGTSDSTVFDVRRMTGDTSRTVLGSSNYPTIKGGDNRNYIEFIPDRTVELQEADVIRMDILGVANGNPVNFELVLFLEKGVPRR